MSSEEGEEEQFPDCSNPTVLQHYLHVGQIVSDVVTELQKRCVAGAAVYDLCVYGDTEVVTRLAGYHKKEKDKSRGVGFPTCISVNHVAGHYCPVKPEGDATLKEGDVVKIDIGGHFDGFCVCMATTVPIGKVSDKKAAVIRAAWDAAQATKRLLVPGKKNTEVSGVMQKVADDYKVNVMEGVLSHETRQYVIDHENCIISKQTPEHQVESHEFESNKVMMMDVVMTTGSGRPAERDEKTTVYKRVVENNYNLKVKASRALLTTINKDFPCFPFCLRHLPEDALKKSLLGMKECLQHDLVQPFPVLSEKKGDFIAQFKYTALLLPTTTKFLEPPALDTSLVSDLPDGAKLVDKDVLALLAKGVGKKKKRRKKKKSGGGEKATE